VSTSTPTIASIHTPSPTTAAQPVGSVTVSIDCPTTIDKVTNKNFHIYVRITNVSNFDAAQYDIVYDPDVIKIDNSKGKGVTAGNIAGTTIPIDDWSYQPANTQGVLRIVNSIPNAPGVSGEGYLADLYFKVMGKAGDSSTISFVKGFGDPQGYLMIGNNLGIEIPSSWTNSSITIE